MIFLVHVYTSCLDKCITVSLCLSTDLTKSLCACLRACVCVFVCVCLSMYVHPCVCTHVCVACGCEFFFMFDVVFPSLAVGAHYCSTLQPQVECLISSCSSQWWRIGLKTCYRPVPPKSLEAGTAMLGLLVKSSLVVVKAYQGLSGDSQLIGQHPAK